MADNASLVNDLITMASRMELVTINYHKPAEQHATERCVEAYNFFHSAAGAVMVHCWQCDPSVDDPCWRNFRTDRIVGVFPTGKTFEPRRSITLHTGESTLLKFKPRIIPPRPKSDDDFNDDPEKIYLDYVMAAAEDYTFTEAETAEACRLAKRVKYERLRIINARIFALALDEVMLDGEITNTEEAYLDAIRGFLQDAGFCP